MFSQSKILYLAEKKLRVVKVGFKKNQPVVEKEVQKDFSTETLAKVLEEIKKELKTSSWRVLLPENKVYLQLLEFPVGMALTRDLVLEKAQEAVPEKLEEGYFDWKQVGADKEAIKIQVLATAKKDLVILQEAAQKAKIKLEAFESPAFALARQTAAEKEPQLIIYQNLAVAAFQGQVFGVMLLDKSTQSEEELEKFQSFIKDKWGIELKTSALEVLDPVFGLALKEDLGGKDEQVLNLTPPKLAINFKKKKEMASTLPVEEDATQEDGVSEISSGSETEPIEEEKPKVYKKLLIIAGAVLVVCGLVVGGVILYRNLRKEEVVEPEPVPVAAEVTPTPTMMPEPTPAPELDREDLTVQVLNGSGTPGLAGVAKDFLEGLGYPEVETGNADSYDYEQTEIAIKDSKAAYLALLQEDLEDDYFLSTDSAVLAEEDNFDAVVTIGKE
ncbi:LytR C-terminal domain-containing protein [Patescibacteria group bacterium]